MVENEKEIEINGQKFVIKKFTFGQMNQIINVGMGNTPEHPRADELFKKIILFGLKQAPFLITPEHIDNLPVDVGYALLNEISNFNELFEMTDSLKKTNLDKNIGMFGSLAQTQTQK